MNKAVLPAPTSPMRQILMVRVATRVEGTPAVAVAAAVPEPTRERKSKGENDRETGESTGELRGVSPAMGLPVTSAEKVGETAGGGLV